jgi:hypothetical protein
VVWEERGDFVTREQEKELDAYTLLASAKAVAQDGITEGTMPFVKEAVSEMTKAMEAYNGQ